MMSLAKMMSMQDLSCRCIICLERVETELKRLYSSFYHTILEGSTYPDSIKIECLGDRRQSIRVVELSLQNDDLQIMAEENSSLFGHLRQQTTSPETLECSEIQVEDLQKLENLEQHEDSVKTLDHESQTTAAVQGLAPPMIIKIHCQGFP
eukprot:UN02566